jgi:hypothetical protein
MDETFGDTTPFWIVSQRASDWKIPDEDYCGEVVE